MELFESKETVTETQSAALVSLVLLLLQWNEQLGRAVAKMMDNISTDPNYYTDETYADMMKLVMAGEAYDEKMERAMLRFRNFTTLEFEETGLVHKDDYYTILFAVSEVKSYIVEMDNQSDKLGIRKELPFGVKMGDAISEMVRILSI
jgi:hypothetical protein